MENDYKKLSLNFLVCCYFGQSKDLVKAAIDRAYVDMASHTLVFQGFDKEEDKIKTKWKCRFDASQKIRTALEAYPMEKTSFDCWHSLVIHKIKEVYEPHIGLSDGQSHKWLNMTIKYLFVFKLLYGEDNERLASVKTFLNNTDVHNYKVPVDSYVLKGVNNDDITWSTMDEKRYNEAYESIMNQVGPGKGFLWELESWEDLVNDYKYYDGRSYAKYYDIIINMAKQ